MEKIVFLKENIFISDLRKQARQLENEIDLKLVSFSKLGTNYSSHIDYGKYVSSNI